MIHRGFPIQRAPQVMKIPPLITTNTVFLEVDQHVLSVFRRQTAQHLIKSPAPDQGVPAPKGFLRKRLDRWLTQCSGPDPRNPSSRLASGQLHRA